MPNDLSHVTVAILAGGRGTRLQPVIGAHQKVVAQINHRPFLSYLLDQVHAAGIRKAVLCVGFDASAVKACIGTRHNGMTIHYSHEETALGTAGAIRHALPMLDTETVLVMNGDSIYKIDFNSFLAFHTHMQSLASIAMTHVDDTSRYGSIVADDSGKIVRFEEKAASSGPGWINAGIYLLHRTIIADIAENTNVSIENDVFPRLAGKTLYGYKGDGYFIDIGTPDSFSKIQSHAMHLIC